MEQRLSGWRRAQGALVALAVMLAAASSASAVDWKGRWSLGVRTGYFVHADKQGGGFRVASGQIFGSRDPRTVNLQDTAVAGLTLGYGLKKFEGAKRWRTADLTLELEVSRWSTPLKAETGFLDPNASTRVGLPQHGERVERDGDEVLRALHVADVTTTPVLVNTLLHWGSPRADFYAGVGAGLVLVQLDEASEYGDFVGDADRNEVLSEDVWAVNVKLGSNLRLARSGNWYLFFEGQFFTTQLLGSQQQISWPGVDDFFGTQLLDTDDDNNPDTPYPADYRLVDPGKIRIDGGVITMGVRYRFGGKGE